jgi:uroporphyrinogen-III synthase
VSAVVVTRDEPEDGPLSTLLRAAGLTVLSWPVVRVQAPADPAPLEQALCELARFDWIVFASQHAVHAVSARVAAPPPGLRIAAVGARTAETLASCGWPAEAVPAAPNAEALVAVLAARLDPGARVLFPASSRALPTIEAGLTRLGVHVTQVEAYRTEAAPAHTGAWRASIDADAVAAVTFTSPSAVIELERALGRPDLLRLLEHAAAVALGPTTGRALSERGVVCVLAEPPTLPGLATTTLQVLQTRA